MLRKPGKAPALMGHLARIQTLPLPLSNFGKLDDDTFRSVNYVLAVNVEMLLAQANQQSFCIQGLFWR